MHRILPTSSPASAAIPSNGSPHSLGSLFLGSIAATMDRELLSSHKITHLVQVLDAPWVPVTEKDGFRCLRISILDAPTADLRPHLEGACNFIGSALQGGSNVLVHCQQGVSRSSSVVIAYLIHNLGMSYDQAFALVKKRRPCIRPNTGFVSVLRAWEGKWRAQVAASTPGPSSATAAPQIRRFNTSYMGLHHHSNSPYSMTSPSGSSSPAAPSSTPGAGKHLGGAGSASASASAASSSSSPSSAVGHAGGIAAPSMARGVSYAGHGNAPTFTLKAPPAFHMKHRASAAAPHAVTPVHAS